MSELFFDDMDMKGIFTIAKELQKALQAVNETQNAMNVSSALDAFCAAVKPIRESVSIAKVSFDDILKTTKSLRSLSVDGAATALKLCLPSLQAISTLTPFEAQEIVKAYSNFSSDDESNEKDQVETEGVAEISFSRDELTKAIEEIIEKKKFSPDEKWNNEKKKKWKTALSLLCSLILFFCAQPIEYGKDKLQDALGITQFWEKTGVYELIDSYFSSANIGVVSEVEAKATVDQAQTGNISKRKREDLLAKLKEIRTFISSAPQDENTGNLLLYLSELERDMNGKKYGLVFESHREDIDEVLDTHTPVLTEEKDLFVDKGGQMNFLIEGDNLASLQLLEKTHRGKIDLIYIDPPYNTGNKDFIYADTYVDSSDSFRHSKWLSFIAQRLPLAKKLLSEQGLIFISIDDNEVAPLKLLCDEIFGNGNFKGQIVRSTGTPTGQGNSILSNEIDYVLVYSKTDKAVFNGLPFKNEDSKIYNLQDEYGRYLIRPLRKTGGEDRREDRPSMYYPVTAPDGTKIYPIAPSGYESRWRCQESTYYHLDEEHRIEWKKDKEGWKVYQKFYLEGRTKQPGNLWTEIEGNKKATITVRSILGANAFSFPKPVELITRIATIASSKESCVLDFFAGSGTTGHAILSLNAEDGGNRRFILCTNNENDICRNVTYERVKRVINDEQYSASLKYFKVGYVPIYEKMYYEYADCLLAHIRELVELENGINFTGNAEVGIVLTEEELDQFIAEKEAFSKCRKLYMGHDLLPSEEQELLLHENGIELSIIPDYYYRDLQEK